ncbi:hypothetical protein BGX27_001324, partial [Mortierella sp. AM989]
MALALSLSEPPTTKTLTTIIDVDDGKAGYDNEEYDGMDHDGEMDHENVARLKRKLRDALRQ